MDQVEILVWYEEGIYTYPGVRNRCSFGQRSGWCVMRISVIPKIGRMMVSSSFNKSLLPIAIGVCYFLSLPLISSLFSISIVSKQLQFLFYCIALSLIGLLLSIPGPCIRTVLMNVNRPHCRSTAIALSEVFNSLGRIIGPMLFIHFCKLESAKG